MTLDLGNPVPVCRSTKVIFGDAPMDRQGGCSCLLDNVSDFPMHQLLSSTSQPNLCRDGGRCASPHEPSNDPMHALRLLEEIATAMSLLRNLPDWAAEINVDHADLILFNQPLSNFRHRLGVIVPNLYR
jgi:hypothetical protein